MLIGIFSLALKNLGFLPVAIVTNYAILIGSVFEVTLLSLALADHINKLKREVEKTKLETHPIGQNERSIYSKNLPRV